ncbi:MAG: lysoplasmalogenase [Cytophagales bacterium CG12_big_fil_rev_8_21_14_0_65_40_12]|nr:MAG: lysoplasmalogenase [Cytophagales bacterium CG12_big_fil_rev_8_21_14_0_65_40_12]PIW02814.1 MAG: lysoplasmalogenase [Cytophagales bacterium CG17_big_fil_post_rev_8_21_14_2_50_40_13]
MKISATLVIFFTISIGHLAAIALQLPLFAEVTKPILMIALLVHFNQSVPKTALNKFVNAALILSTLGDTLLIFNDQNPLFFMLGLGAFLLAHLVYIFLNLNLINSEDRKLKFHWRDILFAGFGLFMFRLVRPNLGEMFVPTLVYTVVICIMGITAAKRFGKASKQSFTLVLFGAITFMISDSLLAINKFYTPIDHADLLIMATYLTGQFLIIRGIMAFILDFKKGF